MLVEWRCRKADELNVLCTLFASQAGYRLYERHGFEVVDEHGLDLHAYGVDETEPRRAMIRPAKQSRQLLT
jgi:hypothetical protein